MKKFISLLLCLGVFVITEQTGSAVLMSKPQNSSSPNVKTKSASKVNSTVNKKTTITPNPKVITATPKKKSKAELEIDAYKQKVKNTIDADVAKWSPLVGTKDLSVSIEFGIAENGRINYSVVTKSSGNSSLDYTAKEMVYNIYDPLPKSFHGTCSRADGTNYRGKCLVVAHTITRKAKLPEGYVKPKNELDKNRNDQIEDMQKSINELFMY